MAHSPTDQRHIRYENETEPNEISIPVTHMKKPDHHIKFRIGSDDLGVLQELLTSERTPVASNSALFATTRPNDRGPNNKPPPRMSSASSISTVDDSSECLPMHRKFVSEVSQAKQVLIELFDLKLKNGGRALLPHGSWEETARWIKYEEDVEGVDHQRWGLPHISFLSFHALLQLRKCIGKGVILLDVDVADFDELSGLIANAIATQWSEIGPQCKRIWATKQLTNILQLRQNHVRDRRISRISTTATSLAAHFWERGGAEKTQLMTPRRTISAMPLTTADVKGTAAEDGTSENGVFRFNGCSFTKSPPTITEDDESVTANNSIHRGQQLSPPPTIRKFSTPNVKLNFDTVLPTGSATTRSAGKLHPKMAAKRHSSSKKRRPSEVTTTQHNRSGLDVHAAVGAQKKLQADIELVQVLVGELHWMHKPRFVMVRLAEGRTMPEIVETCHPVRIVFVILGPALSDGSYHELGRSLATLVSNPHFKAIAFGARDRSQLIEGLDSFLDGSLVIPPGEIVSKRLISGDILLKLHRRWQRERRMRNQQKVAAAEVERQQQEVEDMEGDSRHQHLHSANDAEKCSCGAGGEPAVPSNGGGGNDQPNWGETMKIAQRTKRKRHFPLFKGLQTDIASRLPFYWSDIRDAANFHVVFMFFACFVPAISFGGLMGKYTNEHIGTIETLFAQCICGIIWGLFAAQPLMIMSATGPVLIFEGSLYTFCETLQLDFLTIRFYAGLFIMLIAICIAALDGSRLLVFVTRFTEDIFAFLISAIFIAESLHFIWHTFKENPVEDYSYYEKIHVNCRRHVNNNQSVGLQPNFAPLLTLPFDVEGIGNSSRNRTADSDSGRRLVNALAEIKDPMGTHRFPCGEAEPNTALLTAIIVFATFILALLLKKLRESFYLGRHLRRAIGDFGVLISITVVTLIVHWCIPDPYLQRLDMPDHINFTNPTRRSHGLLVAPKLPFSDWRGILVSLIAALLVFILLFVETEITELLLSRKERGCRKGCGMHWDLVLMGICAFLCSVFGLPWMCAAAVQSLAHCSSLTVMKKTAPGARPEVDCVIEQRITTIGVALLIGLIAFGGSYLRLPLASLFGVFLYLGVMNLCGVQLIQRVVLFFIPEKYFPVTPYTEQMSIWRMHLYTWIQLVCVFIVYTKTALAFPFVLMLFIFFRQIILPKIFTTKELEAIDGEGHSENEDWSSKEFYDSPPPLPV
uniref:Anion exchange protein n=1 Tax=Globodera pallida TaxID=36090 RepID=A0A183BYR0_GLOPA